MDSEKRDFLVIRCSKCKNHFGSLSSKESFCPNCGEFASHPIVDRAKDSRDLSNRVAMANVPTDLREDLEKKLRNKDTKSENYWDSKGIKTCFLLEKYCIDLLGCLNPVKNNKYIPITKLRF